MDKRYQVFISSTYTDLKEERKAIIEGLLNAKYIPAGMEMFAASNDEQFKYIKKIIDTCDYYILIVGARYGSINSSTGKSFTEQEYEYAVEKGIPVLAFLHDDPFNLPADKRDDDNRQLLHRFREKVSTGRLCKMWHTSAELISSVIISLGEEVADNPQRGWTRGNFEENVSLLSQLNELRIRNEQLEKSNYELRKKIEGYITDDNLVSGKALFLITGNKKCDYYNGHGDNKATEPLTYALSWDEIFSTIGPYLFAGHNIYTFTEKLKNSLNSIYDIGFGDLDDNCVNTIIIQLCALGLIEIGRQKLKNGLSTEEIFITDKGKQYLIYVKAIKK